MKTINTNIARKSFDDKFVLDLYFRTNNVAHVACILKHLNPNNKIRDLVDYVNNIVNNKHNE